MARLRADKVSNDSARNYASKGLSQGFIVVVTHDFSADWNIAHASDLKWWVR